jgi:vesicle coat complex subunit
VRDLGSKNVMEANIALTAAVDLIPPEMAPMVVPVLLEKTTHTKDFIRKKSLVCLQKMLKRNPSLAAQIESRVYQRLTDQGYWLDSAMLELLYATAYLFGTSTLHS